MGVYCLLKMKHLYETFTIFILFFPPLRHLFGFVLLIVARGHQTVRIDAFIVGWCIAMGTGVGLLHSQEGADALDLALEAAVGQSLAFGAQSTCSHPLSVLLLLRGARVKDKQRERQREREGCGQRREIMRQSGRGGNDICDLFV